MSQLSRFAAYAAAFEQTYADNDWSRLDPYFADDAVYIVSGLPFGCELRGREAILRGIRRSVDGFDRHMTTREIVATAPARELDGKVVFAGFVRYSRGNAPPVEMHATIVAELVDDKIVRMHDTFALDGNAETWLVAHARDLDGSYH